MSATRPVLVFVLICIALLCSSGGRVYAVDSLPDDMVKAGMMKLADAGRLHGNSNDSSEQELVDAVRTFLAEFTDVSYAARLISASYWNTATPEQRQRFVAAFNGQVINLVANLIPEVDFDSVRIEPFPGDTTETPLKIQATFRTNDMQTIHFVLVIHERKGRWLIFDVIAEGISYVKTYRYQFTSEISDTGLDATIERLVIRSSWREND